MSLYSRFKNVVRRQGLTLTFVKSVGVLADYWFEWRYQLDTIRVSSLDDLTINAASRTHGTSYEGIRVLPARGMLRYLKRIMPEGGAFVDLGCGKAKALLVAVQVGIRKARGIEFARELCVVAQKNWVSFQQRSGCPENACDIIEGDVTTYAYPADESVYFINNPFDEVILSRVLEGIAASVRAHPRGVLLVICNLSPHYRAVMDARRDFQLQEVRRSWGYPFSIFACVPQRSGTV
jgi:hypothetical protein